MNKVISLICRLLLFLILFHAGAVARRPFVIRSFASAEMPASRINCLFQDRRGFIWIGAFDGLYRYDGYRYVHYRQEANDSCSLGNSVIWNICEDARGTLWIATNDGVSRLDTHSGCFTAVPFPVDRNGVALPAPSVRAIFADSRECVWAGALDGNLYRLDLTTLQWKLFPTGSPDKTNFVGGTVRAFHEDAEGFLWIGSIFSPNLLENISTRPIFP